MSTDRKTSFYQTNKFIFGFNGCELYGWPINCAMSEKFLLRNKWKINIIKQLPTTDVKTEEYMLQVTAVKSRWDFFYCRWLTEILISFFFYNDWICFLSFLYFNCLWIDCDFHLTVVISPVNPVNQELTEYCV